MRLVLATLLLCCALAGPARAATYYVDQQHPHAGDSNPGLAVDAPWRTLLPAMQVAAGNTVYVKSGTYAESNNTIWGRRALRPLNSGRPDAPIAFRAYPGHQVTLQVVILGNAHSDYIIWDGFVLAAGMGVVLYGSPADRVVGTVIENCLVQPGPVSGQTDNYDGFFLQHTSHTVIRNCIIRDVYFVGDSNPNASGIKLYGNDRVLVENNEIYRTNAGIFDKGGGQLNTYRNNYIHDVYHTGVLFSCFGHHQVPCYGTEIYQNIISHAGVNGIAIGSSIVLNVPFRDFRVYNNTLYKVGNGFSNGTTPGLRMWNNIVYATGVAMYLWNVRTDIALSNYSNFYPTTRFAGNQTNYFTLPSWQKGTELDLNSIRQDPLFVDADARDFRLRPTSPLRGGGRVGGVPNGAAIDMGAYPTGTERIGPDSRSHLTGRSPPWDLRGGADR